RWGEIQSPTSKPFRKCWQNRTENRICCFCSTAKGLKPIRSSGLRSEFLRRSILLGRGAQGVLIAIEAFDETCKRGRPFAEDENNSYPEEDPGFVRERTGRAAEAELHGRKAALRRTRAAGLSRHVETTKGCRPPGNDLSTHAEGPDLFSPGYR